MAEEMLKVEHFPTTVDDIRVGDIFHSQWGATMLMNTFWKVVKRTKKFVTLRALRRIEKGTDYLSGVEYPVDEFEEAYMCDKYRFTDKDGNVYKQVTRRLPESGTCVKIEYYMYASPWKGKPASFDHCD